MHTVHDLHVTVPLKTEFLHSIFFLEAGLVEILVAEVRAMGSHKACHKMNFLKSSVGVSIGTPVRGNESAPNNVKVSSDLLIERIGPEGTAGPSAQDSTLYI
jgi:hypothetical protein